jgi:hypothetical protein
VRSAPGPTEKVTDRGLITNAIEQWRTVVEQGLQSHLPVRLGWSEDIGAPYFTDQINWFGYTGVLLLAAHTEYPQFPMPQNATDNWNIDPAYKKLRDEQFKGRFNQLFNVELWLPIEFPFVFKTEYFTGQEVWCGSSITLLKQLELLNQETFKAQDSLLAQWRLAGDGRESGFIETARFGLAVLIRLAKQAIEHNLPMRLDY